MTDTIHDSGKSSAGEIAFGFNRETDEKSLKILFARFTDRELLETIIPRLDNKDIQAVLDLLSGLMKKHLSEKEYHRLFMGDK